MVNCGIKEAILKTRCKKSNFKFERRKHFILSSICFFFNFALLFGLKNFFQGCSRKKRCALNFRKPFKTILQRLKLFLFSKGFSSYSDKSIRILNSANNDLIYFQLDNTSKPSPVRFAGKSGGWLLTVDYLPSNFKTCLSIPPPIHALL